ncbi:MULTISPECIES: uroporphyrinogen-III C-methyltransferase [Acidianus]|uniref:uroporphyrinogen-III C-methyltransferase n=1 Tax=Candidatus Acidianus copahuensis TaxID=1160895 RepID=A0A031LSV5_9CREN|nr:MULTISPECIES: uroporphyrinogen-III C-methyltransferase [Acidianus]EZQ10845.1 uroporphyrin-III methyltransferase [Candidatus Acidianus copahuensis]NON61233.1 uroporphyrinogen-III C-methyltransferase [Acidianus sp. RZ1]
MGKIYLVGSGPGDPGLITVKGIEILRKSDVVIYDKLIPKEILSYCKGDAELIYYGKGIGDASLQDKINELLVRKAKEKEIVTRLKGGDPYVFGRGEEECVYAAEHGIECEVIPGITSAIAVPAYAGIPVTSRWFSSGFTVITGTRAEGSPINLDYVPKKGTLIILMGVERIDEIRKELLKVRSGDVPVAIIENGTTKSQRVFISTLDRLHITAKDNDIRPPAIILVGEVIELRNKLWKIS